MQRKAQARSRILDIPALYEPGRSFIALDDRQRAAAAELSRRAAEGMLETSRCLCEGEDFGQLAGVDRYGVRQDTVMCERCGLIQSNPRMSAEALGWFYGSDAYRRLYDGDEYLDVYARLYESPNDRPLRALLRHGRVESVMEFGAGGGWNLMPFMQAGVRAAGYDISDSLVQLGVEHGIDLRRGGIDDVEGTWDAIVACHVIEHLPDVVEDLRALRAHLTVDGHMYVEVPDIAAFDIRQLQSAHLYYFTQRTLAWTLGQAGFRPLEPIDVSEGPHMAVVCAVSDEPPPGIDALAGHRDEMMAIVTRYRRRWRYRPVIAALHRAVAAVRRT